LCCETALNGDPVGYFAPTYKLLREVFEECKKRLSPIIVSANLSDKVIRLATGGVIDFWTLDDPDAGRSRKYKRVIIDEAGMVKDLGQTYNSAIRPTLTDLIGDLWLCGTPKGKGWFHSAFTKGQDPSQANWASWQKPTRTNPYISKDEIEEARLDPLMVERLFQQEYEAVFLDDAGGVFLGVDRIVQAARKTTGKAGSIGIDLAKTEDFTVLVALDDEGDQIDFDRFNRIDWDRQIQRICDFIKRHPGFVVYMDSTGVGDPIYEAVRKALPQFQIYGYKLTHQSKSDLINSLAMQTERQAISIWDEPMIISEMKSYEYTFNARTRNVTTNAPEGMHDDIVIALGLAAWPIRERQPTVFTWNTANWI
jgi:hypothetical protein